ncbi:BrxA family protein [uncultured Jannaschia sp.]|uniref:BrxA family protein n=1 Tax=uncultured Jannaschia sp. TaxID=293347 RepID=UPI00261B4E85|nr:BrxA family protein [uncultured Jannaschia sp.]
MTPPPYTLSFTVGGLFLFEGIELARLRGSCASWKEVRKTAPDDVFVAKGGANSVKRIRNEVIGRLSALSPEETDHLASAGMTDARALMWVAACRKYRILAERGGSGKLNSRDKWIFRATAA